tara:strand:- start:95 stop:667 length:573 start_codon:yes stop_codon:yes gene_type:complete
MLETELVLNKFWETVISESKQNLRSKKKNASGRLSDSLGYNLKVNKPQAKNIPSSFESDFFMEDYGEFVDQGVIGVGGIKADGTQWKKKNASGSPYKYSSPSKTNSRGGFLLALNGWTIKRGIAPRSSTGKFQKRKGMLRAIRKSVIHTGLERTLFFRKPFDKWFKTLPEEVTEAYGLDVENFLKFSLNA